MKRLAFLMLLSCAAVLVSRVSNPVPGHHAVADEDDSGDSDDGNDDS
jgi:hypothetical protein